MSTILLAGGNGQISLTLALFLAKSGASIIISSRKGIVPASHKGVKFDFNVKSTYTLPFDAAPINKVFIVCPPDISVAGVTGFINYGLTRGLNRVVLVTGTTAEPGAHGLGQIHAHILKCGVDYVVLCPTFFQENFISPAMLFGPIMGEDTVYSATKQGRIPWISLDNIAAVAERALLNEKSHNTDHILVSPEPLTYDESVAQLSDVIGRKITHQHLTNEELMDCYLSLGYCGYVGSKTRSKIDFS